MTHCFTKENPQAWFTYFNSLCDRNGLLDDQAKIDALDPCLASNTFLFVQPLLDGTHSFGEIKDFLVNKFTRPLDQRLQELLRISSLGDLEPSDFLEQARSAVSRDDMSDAVLCEILIMKLPTEVQTTLSIILGSPLNEFATAADTAMRRFSAPLVSSINSSTPPFSQNNHNVQQLKFEMPHNLLIVRVLVIIGQDIILFFLVISAATNSEATDLGSVAVLTGYAFTMLALAGMLVSALPRVIGNRETKMS